MSSLTTTVQCQNPGCAYGQSFDSVKCVCNCFSGFSGPLCGVLDCNLLTDAFECSLGLFTCLTPEEVGQCPNLCGYFSTYFTVNEIDLNLGIY